MSWFWRGAAARKNGESLVQIQRCPATVIRFWIVDFRLAIAYRSNQKLATILSKSISQDARQLVSILLSYLRGTDAI